MSHRLARALLGALAALALLPACAAAATPALVVDGASRGGRCSDARAAAAVSVRRPWCTPARALQATPAGATVLVRRGRYARTSVQDVRPADWVTLAPFRRERPVLDGVELTRVAHVRLRGLTLSSGVLVREATDVQVLHTEIALTPGGRTGTDSGVILDEVRRVVVRGNHVHDGRDGVNVVSAPVPSSDVTVAGNHFQRLGNDGVHVNTGRRVLVVGNHFDDVRVRDDVDPEAHSDAIQMEGPTEDVTFWGNRVTGGRGFLVMMAVDDFDEPGWAHTGLVIADNVLLGPQIGIRLFSTPGARIVHNTVWGSSVDVLTGIDIRDRVGDANARNTGLVLANNLAKRLAVDPRATFAARGGNLVGDGARSAEDLAGAPVFAGLAAGDVALAPGSPGVAAAVPALATAFDLEGRTRDARPDAGAYERGGLPAPLRRVVARLRAAR